MENININDVVASLTAAITNMETKMENINTTTASIKMVEIKTEDKVKLENKKINDRNINGTDSNFKKNNFHKNQKINDKK